VAAKAALKSVPFTATEKKAGKSFRGQSAGRTTAKRRVTKKTVARKRTPARSKTVVRRKKTPKRAASGRFTKNARGASRRRTSGRGKASTTRKNTMAMTKAARSKAAKKGWARKRRAGTAKKSTKRRTTRRPAAKRRRTTTRRRTTAKRNSKGRFVKNGSVVRRRKKSTTRRRPAAKRRTTKRTTKRRAYRPNAKRRTTRAVTRRKPAKRRSYRANRGFTSATAKKAARKRWRKAGTRGGRGARGVKLTRGTAYYKGRKPAALKNRSKVGRKRIRKLPKGRVYLTNRRSTAASRSRAAKLGWSRRRRGGTARRRSYTSNRSVVRRRKTTARRRPGRVFRRNGKGSVMDLVKTGAVGFAGFGAQKGITAALDYQIATYMAKSGATAGFELSHWRKAGIGALVTALGAYSSLRFIGGQAGMASAVGMVLSELHTIAVTALTSYPSTAQYAGYLAGVPGRAAAIGGLGAYVRRGAPQQSILPEYVPTGRPGGMQQAVAMSGGMGEYFQASGVGEYFASGVQGVGHYESAGPMAIQASAGVGQNIDDGLRPDGNLDQAMQLAEAQAGVGGSIGEFFTAGSGGGQQRVPARSEWVPNNPLWAGTKPAADSAATSELKAGMFETSGDNGIFG